MLNIEIMNCSNRNPLKSMSKVIFITTLLMLGFFTNAVAQECVSDPSLLVKWDFTNAQECNGIVTNKFKHWKPNVPLMTGGNQYCPQINDNCGQAIIYEKGFGNTNDFKEAMCVAGFWRNGGNKYFTAPGLLIIILIIQVEIFGSIIIFYLGKLDPSALSNMILYRMDIKMEVL